MLACSSQLPALRRIKLHVGEGSRLGIECARGPHGCPCVTQVREIPGQPQIRIGDIILAIGSIVLLSLNESARFDALRACVSSLERNVSCMRAVVAHEDDLTQSSFSTSLLLDRLQIIVRRSLVAIPQEGILSSQGWAAGDQALPRIKGGRKRKLSATRDADSPVDMTGCWNIKDYCLQYVFYQAPGSIHFCGYLKRSNADAPSLHCYGVFHGSSIEYELRHIGSEKLLWRAVADASYVTEGLLLSGVSRNEKNDIVNKFSAARSEELLDIVAAMQRNRRNVSESRTVEQSNFDIEISSDIVLKVVPLPPAGITLVQSASDSFGEPLDLIQAGDEITLINGKDPKTMMSQQRRSELEKDVVHLMIRR